MPPRNDDHLIRFHGTETRSRAHGSSIAAPSTPSSSAASAFVGAIEREGHRRRARRHFGRARHDLAAVAAHELGRDPTGSDTEASLCYRALWSRNILRPGCAPLATALSPQ